MSFTVSLEFDDDPPASPGAVSGRVVAGGSPISFQGWLGLLAELDRAVRRGGSAEDAELHLVRDRVDGVEDDLPAGAEVPPGSAGDRE